MKQNDKIQAAVYLIDTTLFEDYNFDEMVHAIIKNSNDGTPPQFRYKEDKLTVSGFPDYKIKLYYNFKQKPPRWVGFLAPILTADSSLNSCENTVFSFICFIGFQNHVFAITGGSGSLAIDKFIVQDFGMEIIMRLFQRHHKVIKAIQDRGVTGIVLGQKKFYRGDQRFSDENEFGKIYKQVQAELSRRILTGNFGFKEDELKRKVSGCLAKSSFQISKAIDFSTLLRLISRFADILKTEKNFALNKVNHISKRKNPKLINELNEYLIKVLYNNCINQIESDFDFCHKEFDKYRNASVFSLKIDSTEKIDFDEPIDINVLIEKLKKEDRLILDDDIHFKYSLLELVIVTEDNDGTAMTSGKVIEHLHGEVNYDGKTYFIIDGEWYEIHPNFIEDINKECKDILEQCWDDKLINTTFNHKHKERDFNGQFIGQPNTYVFDTITPENIEACDLLKYDEKSVHLIHVKKGFNNSMRDLAAQISIAARRIKADKLSGYKFIDLLEDQAKAGLFSDSPFMKKIGGQIFPGKGLKQLFEGKHDRNIIFCLAFVDTAKNHRCLKNNLELFDSNIAKYALVELRKEIRGHGFDMKVIQLQKDEI